MTTDSRTAPGRTETREHLTVLYSDLSGSTRLGRISDPEVLDQVIERIKAAATEIIERHGGVMVQMQGDAILAAFGVPTPREDDVRRCAFAALDLHEAIRSIDFSDVVPRGFDVEMHSGIHSGVVLVREGDSLLGRYQLVGDAPNSAAGLCKCAGPGEILASKQALLGSMPFFVTETVAPSALTSWSESLPAYRISDRSGIRTRFEASQRWGLVPFIGREHEIETLSRALERAREGKLVPIRIQADAGLGKTRTVEEFLRNASDDQCETVTGYCEEHGSIAPLWPFQLILRRVFSMEADPHLPSDPRAIDERLSKLSLSDQSRDTIRLIANRPFGGLEEVLRQKSGTQTGLAAIADLFRQLSSPNPLVIFIDDWQWADDASRTATRSLRRLLHDAPILWILASRPTEYVDEIVEGEEQILLEPFRAIESAQAIEAISPDGLDLGTATLLHQRSGGNPLFLEELCRSHRPNEAERNDVINVPSMIHGLIEARARDLPAEQSEVLQCAAVIGNVVPLWLLEALTGCDKNDPILAELAAADLLGAGSTEGTLRFKHGVTRDAIYQSIRLAERRVAHRQIAEALEGKNAPPETSVDSSSRGDSAGAASRESMSLDRPLEALAYHYQGAADFERASEYAAQAGARAWTNTALDRTRQQYAAALAALDQLPESPEVKQKWLQISSLRAFACVFSPAREQLDMLEKAAAIAASLGNFDAVGHALFWHGFVSFSLGELPESIAQYKRGLEAAEKAGNAKLTAQLRANLGQSYVATGDYARALPLIDESLEVKQQLRSDRPRKKPPTGSAFAIACRAMVAGEQGESALANKLIEESLSVVASTGHPVEGSCYGLQAQILLLNGQFEACIEAAERERRIGERVNGPYLFGRGQTEAAFARFMLSGDEAELERLETAAEWLDKKEIRLFISCNFGCLAEALFRVGRIDEARAYAERALARADQLDFIGEGMACRILAQIEQAHATREGRSDEKAEHFLLRASQAAQRRGSQRELALIEVTRALLEAERGETASAIDRLTQNQPTLEKMQLGWYAEDAQRQAKALRTPRPD